METCEGCKWVVIASEDGPGEDHGQCHYYPPKVGQGSANGYVFFPLVYRQELNWWSIGCSKREAV